MAAQLTIIIANSVEDSRGTAHYIGDNYKQHATFAAGNLRQVAYNLCNFLEHCFADEGLVAQPEQEAEIVPDSNR